MTRLVWFRNDLRVSDNPALFDACEDAGEEPVVACYLVSAAQLRAHGEGATRQGFVHESLLALRADLTHLGIPLWIGSAPLFADVPAQLLQIVRACNASAVYLNAEYPLNEAARDRAVSDALAATGVACHIRHGDVIQAPGLVLKEDGSPYSMFTPFKRRWLSLASPDQLTPLPAPAPRTTLFTTSTITAPAAERRPAAVKKTSASKIVLPDPARALADLAPPRPDPDWPAGETSALARLAGFLDQSISGYAESRDYPARAATSRLSPYLAIGAVSVRSCFHQAGRLPTNPGVETWQSELIWREFYRHVIALFPHVSQGRSFRQEMDTLQWRADPTALSAWKAGQTGYPLVDAGMRQLLATGFMHNRLRMITAMFLTKHLLIDWREGERHFMAHLRDADFASNNGGWQWSASTGTDAAPYFRIFNPESQAKKFDGAGAYIRQFVPELGDGRSDAAYPAPIVDHRAARERALAFFKRHR